MGDMGSSDASLWSLSCQLTSFLRSGARDAALGPTSHLLPWRVVAEAGRGSRSKCRACGPRTFAEVGMQRQKRGCTTGL